MEHKYPFIVLWGIVAIATWFLMLAAGNFGINESYWAFAPVILFIEVLLELRSLVGRNLHNHGTK